MMPVHPESNVGAIASNLVSAAILDEVLAPGDGLTELFARMTAFANEMRAAARGAKADWQQLLGDTTQSDDDVWSNVDRQSQSFGEAWAARWLLCHVAKQLGEELERSCLESSASSAIEQIEYGEDGAVVSWKMRNRE